MKNLKKVLALVIALTMVLSTVAFASYADVDYEADYAGAVELLSALNVLKGDENGNFNPDNTITRAEFAAVVCRCLGLESSASSAAGATAFTDVAADHWAAGYVNLATQYGIINGRGNGIFDPNGNVTFAEAVKMLVVAMGYEPMAATKGGYPTGYLTVANGTKMTAGVSAGGANAAALRSTVAQLAANALEIPKMDQVGFGSDTSFEAFDDFDNYATMLTAMDIFKLTGIASVDKKEGEVTISYREGSEDYEFGYTNKGALKGDTNNNGVIDNAETVLTETFNIADSNIVDFDQKNVDVYVVKIAKGKYDVLFAKAASAGSSLVVKGDSFAAGQSAIGDTEMEYYETKTSTKTTKVDVIAAPPVYVNGQLSTLTNVAIAGASVEFVDTSDDEIYDIINITIYEHALVEEVDAAKEKLTFVDGSSIRFDSEDDEEIVEIFNAAGEKIALEDLKAGDVLAMVVGSDLNGNVPRKAKVFNASTLTDKELTIYNLGANAVTGAISETDTDAGVIYVYIDGTEYEVAAAAGFVDSAMYGDVVKSGEGNIGAEGTFYLSIGGSIIGFEGDAASSEKYGYVLQANYDASGFNNGWQVKMLTADGIAIYDLYKSVEIDGTNFTTAVPSSNTFLSAFVDVEEVKAAGPDTILGTDDDVITTPAVNYSTNVSARIVEYKLSNDGKIKYINDSAATSVSNTFKEDICRLDGKMLAEDITIFDINCAKADDAKVVDLSALVDEGTYGGFVAGLDDGEYKVFVMTSGNAAFNGEDAFNVVTSVRSTTYNGDDSAKIVKYYSNGEAEEKTAIFTADSTPATGSAALANLEVGEVFIANVDSEGVVAEYAILAEISAGAFAPNAAAFAGAYGTTEFKTNSGSTPTGEITGDGVSYLYGYYEAKNSNGTYTFKVGANDYTFRIPGDAAAYYYTMSRKAIVEVGDWMGVDVDVAETNDVDPTKEDHSYVLIKLYDGAITDIYAFNARVTE